MRLKKMIIWNQQKIVGKIFTLIGVIFLIDICSKNTYKEYL